MDKVVSLSEYRMEQMYREYYSAGRVNLKYDTVYRHKPSSTVHKHTYLQLVK